MQSLFIHFIELWMLSNQMLKYCINQHFRWASACCPIKLRLSSQCQLLRVVIEELKSDSSGVLWRFVRAINLFHVFNPSTLATASLTRKENIFKFYTSVYIMQRLINTTATANRLVAVLAPQITKFNQFYNSAYANLRLPSSDYSEIDPGI